MRRSAAVRRVFTFAACAAALLASFEDEAISAVTPTTQDEVSSQTPSDPADGFPDLFRDSVSVDAGAGPLDRSEPAAVFARVDRRSSVALPPPGRSAAILFGVWRI